MVLKDRRIHMNFQETMNQLTGRGKLLKQIEKLELQLQKLQGTHQALKADLKDKTDKQVKLVSLLNQLKERDESLVTAYRKLEADHKILANDQQTYKQRYGEIIEPVLSENQVSEYDADKSFFDHMEKIKGNPFNVHQVQAIRYPMDKNLRIIAGAGSGKTETICVKTSYLMQMEQVPASAICMVTFTRKAANEMAERVNEFLGTDNSRVAIGTFHRIFRSLFEQLLKQEPACAVVGVVGSIQDDSNEQAGKLFRNLIRKHQLYALDKEGEKNLRERIDYWTNLAYDVHDMKIFIAKHYKDLDIVSAVPIESRFYNLYTEFLEERSRQQIVIYDDYLINLYKALQQYESARQFIQNRFRYIFVDEFQDINPLQVEILRLIAPPDGTGAKLIIVGDDDQSIYAFRGSDPQYIKEFHTAYDTCTIELMTNYRSKQNIVQAGNRVISHNAHDRIEKRMTPFHPSSGDAYVRVAVDQKEEAEWIIKTAQQLGKASPFVYKGEQTGKIDPINYTSSTVLYRSVGQLQAVYQALDSRNIPYVIESNEDIMGIFNVFLFKQAFQTWNILLSEESIAEAYVWETLLQQTARAYFIRNIDFKNFMDSHSATSVNDLLKEFVAFIRQQKPRVDVSLLPKYFNGLVKLFKNDASSVQVIDFVDPLLQFPVYTKDLTKEESDWIRKECEAYPSWSKFIGYHQRLRQRQKEMKKNLERYHKGEYNALQFMTIHKSKGLAFTNVFVIGVYDGGLPSVRAIPLRDINLIDCREKAEPLTTIEEERRLMYVAATRAKHNLYITFPQTVQGKPVKRSIFLKELQLPIQNG